MLHLLGFSVQEAFVMTFACSFCLTVPEWKERLLVVKIEVKIDDLAHRTSGGLDFLKD